MRQYFARFLRTRHQLSHFLLALLHRTLDIGLRDFVTEQTGLSPWRTELGATLRLAAPLAAANLLQMLRTCTVFMDTDDGRRVKVVGRYQQYRAARRVVLEVPVVAERLEVVR